VVNTNFHRVLAVKNYAEIVSLFIDPFTSIKMGLAEQVRKLSAYAHVVCALYQRHQQKFMKGPLYADSMSIVKTIMVLVARYQAQDSSIPFYIIQVGTDREEGVFSQIRTQDHTRNCDILQLGQKSCIGAEINRILKENPDLNRGHSRRSIKNSRDEDHINPASLDHLVADFRVSSVDLVAEYLSGREKATEMVTSMLGWRPDWDEMWENGRNDLLRPCGRYVGSQTDKDNVQRAGRNDDESDEGDEESNSAPSLSAGQPVPKSVEDLAETNEEVMGADADQQVDAQREEDCPVQKHSTFIEIEGKRYCKSTACTKYLISSSSRKVVIRQFRAAGMTIKDITQRTSSSISFDDSNTSKGDTEKTYLFNKDLGAILCRCNDGRTIALVVIEILHFKFGRGDRAGRITFDLEQRELETDGLNVVGQVIDLCQDSLSDGRWIWPMKYINTREAQTDKIADTGEQYQISVPGTQFYPLRPGIDESSDKLTWALDSAHLEKVSSDLWSFLDPESDSILISIDKLTKISSPAIPYCANGQRKFVINAAESMIVKKHDGDDMIPCHFCGVSFKLKNMHNHVGIHIL
jgi:hypothetical protein